MIPEPSALHVPPKGDGGWFVALGSLVVRAQVKEIVWDGETFEAIAIIPGQGATILKGTVDRAEGRVSLTMTDTKGNTQPIGGSIVTVAGAEGGE